MDDEALRKVRHDLVNNWCKGAFAFDVNGEVTSARGPEAVNWCYAGVFIKHGIPIDSHEQACQDKYGMGIVEYNDSKGHEAAIKFFDEVTGGTV